MRCVAIDVDGVVRDVVPQPASVTECTLVLVQPGEFLESPFRLSVEDASVIGGGITLCWLFAWLLRPFVAALKL